MSDTTPLCGPTSTQTDQLMKPSKMEEVGFSSATQMVTSYQDLCLLVNDRPTTGPKSPLCEKLPDYSVLKCVRLYTPSSSQTVNPPFRACSHPVTSWKETRCIFCAKQHNTLKLQSSGSLLTVALQETRRQIDWPSLTADCSNQNNQSRTGRQRLSSRETQLKNLINTKTIHLMTR